MSTGRASGGELGAFPPGIRSMSTFHSVSVLLQCLIERWAVPPVSYFMRVHISIYERCTLWFKEAKTQT